MRGDTAAATAEDDGDLERFFFDFERDGDRDDENLARRPTLEDDGETTLLSRPRFCGFVAAEGSSSPLDDDDSFGM